MQSKTVVILRPLPDYFEMTDWNLFDVKQVGNLLKLTVICITSIGGTR